MSALLNTGGGRVSFRSADPGGAGVRVQAGVGVVEVDCTTSASYIGAVLSTDDARLMAEALVLAADQAEAVAARLGQ